MVSSILSNRRPLRKDGIHQSGINGLPSLGTKLHTMAHMANIAVKCHLTDAELFHMMSGIDDLMQQACELCDSLDTTQIAADVSAKAAEPNTAE